MGAPAKARAFAEGKTFTVNDLLQTEDIGKALIDPTGKWLVFVHVPPIGQRSDYGSEIFYGPVTGELMAADLKARSAPKQLFKPEPGTTYWIESFSRNGRWLAFYRVKQGKVGFGVYDFRSDGLKVFPPTPEISYRWDFSPVWVSDDEIVYAALPVGREPWAAARRRYTAARLSEAWEKTWKGREPSVSVVTSDAGGGGITPRGGILVRANARTGEAIMMAEGMFADLRVSSSGRYLAASRQFEAEQPLPDRLNNDWMAFGRSQLEVFDLYANKVVKVASDKSIAAGSIEWAPNRDSVAFFGWDMNSNIQSGMFYVCDPQTKEIHGWPHMGLDLASERERGWLQRPERAAWLGNRLAIVARAITEGDQTPRFSPRGVAGRDAGEPGKPDWFLLSSDGSSRNLTTEFRSVSPMLVGSTTQGLFLLADDCVWHISVDGTKTNLTEGLKDRLELAQTPGGVRERYGESATLIASNGETPKFALVDLSGHRSVSFIVAPPRGAEYITSSIRANAVVFRQDNDTGTDLMLQGSSGSSIMLEHLNSFVSQIVIPQWHVLTYRVGGNRELKSCMLLPAGYTPGKRYPTIVDIYPSNEGGNCLDKGLAQYFTISRNANYSSPYLLPAQGYIYFEVANPGDLDRSNDGPIARMADVVSQGLDALVAQGYADPERIGLIGISQGGFSALWLATQSDRFKAIISINGWSDMVSHDLSATFSSMFYSDQFPFTGETVRYEGSGSDFSLGRTLWQEPDAYLRNSPVFQVDKVHTPIMLVHSDMDFFPMGQYDEMFTALYRLRKQACYVRYWGEGHGPASPANILDLWQRIFAWYDKYLGSSRIQNGARAVIPVWHAH